MTQNNGFSKNADLYRISNAHSEMEDVERGLEALPELTGLSCLDVATGTGHTAFLLAQKHAHVFAVDVNPQMLEVAQEESDRQTLSVRFLKSPAEELMFDDDSFDLVTCRLAAHHFQDLPAFLSQVARVLRPGGHLLLIDNVVPDDKEVSDWMNSFEQNRDPTHVACLSAVAWRDLLTVRGFQVERSEPFPKTLEFLPWMKRMSVEGEAAAEQWRRLVEAPEKVREYWKPCEGDDGRKKLTLRREIIVASI